MPKKVLNTQTTISRIDGNVDIFTFFEEGDRSLSIFLCEEVKNVGGISFLEGELGVTYNNFNTVRFFINSRGEFIATGNEASNFSIDGSGNLIYEEL
ncbi:MAG: hypothetical protein M0R03_20575 [Novosphingobium sp.]|nr:hypothetical protein [Novosphingobium sp.]